MAAPGTGGADVSNDAPMRLLCNSMPQFSAGPDGLAGAKRKIIAFGSALRCGGLIWFGQQIRVYDLVLFANNASSRVCCVYDGSRRRCRCAATAVEVASQCGVYPEVMTSAVSIVAYIISYIHIYIQWNFYSEAQKHETPRILVLQC